MKKFLLFGLFFGCSLSIFAQPTNSRIRVSLLTCSAGEDIYTIFGHSALRVVDTANKLDVVYNYGTFDVTKNFYSDFLRGKMKYYLDVQSYQSFLYEYQTDKRSVHEQILQLTPDEEQTIIVFLNWNIQPKNAYYKYRFFTDNCTTRIRDIFENIYKNKFYNSQPSPDEKITYRRMAHSMLYNFNQDWIALGLDIISGMENDTSLNKKSQLYLPSALQHAVTNLARKNNFTLASESDVIQFKPPVRQSFFDTPLFYISLISVIIFLISLSKFFLCRKLTVFFDFSIYFITGLLGCVMLLAWFFTDWQISRYNFNLVWAFPFNIVVAFLLFSKKHWISRYCYFIAYVNAILLLTWYFLPQDLNEALIPFVLLLIVRSYYYISNYKRKSYSRYTTTYRRQ